MKKDEVMAMTDTEMRIKVQELLGKDTVWIYTWCDKERGLNENDVPDYPNDIAAAWEPAEQADISVIRVGNEWWAGKFDGSNGDWWFDLGPIENTSAARAITQMFILAMAK